MGLPFNTISNCVLPQFFLFVTENRTLNGPFSINCSYNCWQKPDQTFRLVLILGPRPLVCVSWLAWCASLWELVWVLLQLPERSVSRWPGPVPKE